MYFFILHRQSHKTAFVLNCPVRFSYSCDEIERDLAFLNSKFTSVGNYNTKNIQWGAGK